MKIAILSSGDLSNMKGIMNYVQEKSKRMTCLEDGSFHVDIYLIRKENTLLLNFLQNHLKKSLYRKRRRESTTIYEGVLYHNIWIKYGLLDNLIITKLSNKPMSTCCLKRICNKLEGYDIVVSHTFICHYVAMCLKKKCNIPYVTTWHGSDINVDPYKYLWKKKMVAEIIEKADMNFFVSQALLDSSNFITEKGIKSVIYTGPSDYIKRADENDITEFKKKNGIIDAKIIGFVGNITYIKNVMSLPLIMKNLKENYPEFNYILWVAGDGELQDTLRLELDNNKIRYKFHGKINPKGIPLFMSSLDILILPSLNEGLPLVVLEAIKCNISVVASNVGGIKEAIGIENCFDLNDKFISNISGRIYEIIKKSEPPHSLDPKFSWENAISREIATYYKIYKNEKII